MFDTGATLIASVEKVFNTLIEKLLKAIEIERAAVTKKTVKVDDLNGEIASHNKNIDRAEKLKGKIASIVD